MGVVSSLVSYRTRGRALFIRGVVFIDKIGNLGLISKPVVPSIQGTLFPASFANSGETMHRVGTISGSLGLAYSMAGKTQRVTIKAVRVPR